MLTSLKKSIQGSFNKSKGENTKIYNDALMLIQRETEKFMRDLETFPENRIPNVKFIRTLKNLTESVDEILAPIGKTHIDLEEYSYVVEADMECKKLILKRYTQLISTSQEVTPYATFSEFLKVIQGVNLEQNPEIRKLYQDAVRELFTHSSFETTLVDRVHKKLAILANVIPQNEKEREKIKKFLEHYEQNKFYNPRLSNNALLEAGMRELEAMLFFQEQNSLLKTGEHAATADLIAYINYWMSYFNELPQEEQEARMPLILAADECSRLNNELMNS